MLLKINTLIRDLEEYFVVRLEGGGSLGSTRDSRELFILSVLVDSVQLQGHIIFKILCLKHEQLDYSTPVGTIYSGNRDIWIFAHALLATRSRRLFMIRWLVLIGGEK